jgi:hypothetical protein
MDFCYVWCRICGHLSSRSYHSAQVGEKYWWCCDGVEKQLWMELNCVGELFLQIVDVESPCTCVIIKLARHLGSEQRTDRFGTQDSWSLLPHFVFAVGV